MVRGALPVAAFIATRSTDLADMSDWYKTDIRTPHEKNEVKKNRHFFMSGPYKTALNLVKNHRTSTVLLRDGPSKRGKISCEKIPH